jgi:hypothetical protein
MAAKRVNVVVMGLKGLHEIGYRQANFVYLITTVYLTSHIFECAITLLCTS